MNDAERNNSCFRILSGSALKTIALLTMLLDHTTAIVLSNIPFFTEPLSGIPGNITLYSIFRLIGRAAFPIYGFLLTEGYLHTRNKEKYGLRLLIFAVISEICWDLERSGRLFNSGQNVFFTLFLGLCAIYLYDRFRKDKLSLIMGLAVVFGVSLILQADYGTPGVGYMLFLYVARKSRILQGFIGCCFFRPPQNTIPAFILISLYNGKRGYIKGRVLQYAFYIIYPLHMLILYLIKLYCFGYQ